MGEAGTTRAGAIRRGSPLTEFVGPLTEVAGPGAGRG